MSSGPLPYRLLWRAWQALLLAVLALMLAVVVGPPLAIYYRYFTPEKRAVRARLNEADDKSRAAINERVKPLTELFDKGRKGARAFAAEAVSWNGKWALVKGAVEPGTHREFLAEAFVRHVFTPDELRAVIESVCRAYADDLDGVDNAMLVQLRIDLADPDRPVHELAPHLRDDEAFRREYRALLARVAGDMQSDLAVTAGREVVVLVASDLAARAAVQAARAAAVEMGVQGTVLGAGATSTIATLGIGILAGIVIDAVIEELLKLVGYDAESRVQYASSTLVIAPFSPAPSGEKGGFASLTSVGMSRVGGSLCSMASRSRCAGASERTPNATSVGSVAKKRGARAACAAREMKRGRD